MASSSYNRLIENYGYDVQAGLVVSQFEYADTFMVRDKIEIDQNELTVAQKESLRKYDAILPKRAKEFAKYLNGCLQDWTRTNCSLIGGGTWVRLQAESLRLEIGRD